VDSSGEGPFVSDNLLFSPTATGFKNSAIRITAYLTCNRMADGTIPPVSGTISSNGINVTGSGTSFSTHFNQGDLMRANGQVRTIGLINSSTSLTLLDAYDSNLAPGTTYERLDGFDFEKIIELPLIQEKQAPEITTYLNRSSFSKDQVDAISSAGQSVFDNSFYVILQDRTTRAANIAWPAEVEPQLRNLIAPPVYGAGIYTDVAHKPLVELKDLSDNLISGLTVDPVSINPESPGLHPAITQRVTYTCTVTFTSVAAFTGMSAGDVQDLKLVITATDRAGNRIVDDSKRVRLQINANPYMLDGPTSWLSIDTRVFKIQQGQAKFGVAAGWTNPNTFIQQVIANLRAGNGTAGGESFDMLTQDQTASVLEYSTQVNGITYYNFALSKMRLQSNSGVTNVRASFRFFRWGTANVEFDNTLAYRTAASGIALLGKTSANELASIPFFAEPRVLVSAAMDTQTDPSNLLPTFGPTGGDEDQSYFGAYLDINQSDNRFPNTYVGDGGFSGTLYSIRNLLMGNHQCMVVEVVFGGDPTTNGASPGTSDNLSQRNLLIVQTANPGDEITRTVQHLFDIDLARKRRLHHRNGNHPHDQTNDDHPGHDPMVMTGHRHLNPEANCCEPVEVMHPSVRFFDREKEKAHMEHLKSGWIAQFPELLEKEIHQMHQAEKSRQQWQYDSAEWKPGTGLDELVFFWNYLPKESVVEVYIPGVPVTEIFNYRNLRHAPGTVQIVNENTLRLFVEGITYLPIPPFYGDNLAGLITVQLPKGIKKGQRFKVDVLQMRSDEARVLGGFQLNIQVEKAFELFEQENRTLELFHRRLSLTPKDSRWLPVLQKQIGFTRERAKGFIDLSNKEDGNDPQLVWTDPTASQNGQCIKVILEKIQITDDREPWFKGKGEFQFYANVSTPDNGGQEQSEKFPLKKYYKLSDKAGQNEIVLNETLFEGYVEHDLFIQIGGVELDTFDPADKLCIYKRAFRGKPGYWIGSYNPEVMNPGVEDVGGWKVWYRIEYAG